jgi:hypothetical protein
LGDLRALVRNKGLEGTLCELREQGVYITFEEFKGRKPVKRNGLEFAVTGRDFDNPFVKRDFNLPTGGSTGAAQSVGIDLDHIAAVASNQLVSLEAQDLMDAPTIMWYGILPDFTPSKLLQHVYFRQLPHEWISHIGWRDSKGWLKFDIATLYMLFWLQVSGIPLKPPRIVRLNDAASVAQEIAALVQQHGRCLLSAQVSRALRVALAAQELGLDLTGATIRGGGEPATPAKVRALEKSGARYLSNYATTETGGVIATGCAFPTDGSDVHLFTDAFALIPFPYQVENFGVTVPAFNLTTLLLTAPKLMLNVQLDDYGIVEQRECGCGLHDIGYTTLIRQIRSYSKLTGEGVSLIGNEIIHILEHVLPAQFGGTMQDYQLLEEEDEKGLTRLSLIVSPHIHLQDERAVIDSLLQALRESSSMADAAGMVWKHAETLQVKRMEPIWTGRGKFMPLHLSRTTQPQYEPGEPRQ